MLIRCTKYPNTLNEIIFADKNQILYSRNNPLLVPNAGDTVVLPIWNNPRSPDEVPMRVRYSVDSVEYDYQKQAIYVIVKKVDK